MKLGYVDDWVENRRLHLLYFIASIAYLIDTT
jgi:hypothetical protein